MANAQRGEVELVAGTTSYTLCLSINAICEMQNRNKKTYAEMVASMRSLDINALRDILWMTLKKYHGKSFPDANSVGDLIDSLDNGVNDAVTAIAALFALNESRGEQTVNPPMAQV